SFTISAAAADHLAFAQQPSNTVAGVAISPAVTVKLVDKFGNLATNDNSHQVTLSEIGRAASSAGGTATVSGGVATFRSLVLNTAGSSSLTAMGPGGVSGPAPTSFTISPAAAASLAFFGQPSNTVAGVAISPAVTVKLFDKFGNLATNDSSHQVTLS